MTQAFYTTGQKGEIIARKIYQSLGFRVEVVNWRFGRQGEIDLIAFHAGHNLLAFVEVKTRKSATCGHPFDAVGLGKQQQLRRLAEAYLMQHPPQTESQIRFDVVGIVYPGHGRPAEISHVENAF